MEYPGVTGNCATWERWLSVRDANSLPVVSIQSYLKGCLLISRIRSCRLHRRGSLSMRILHPGFITRFFFRRIHKLRVRIQRQRPLAGWPHAAAGCWILRSCWIEVHSCVHIDVQKQAQQLMFRAICKNAYSLVSSPFLEHCKSLTAWHNSQSQSTLEVE